MKITKKKWIIAEFKLNAVLLAAMWVKPPLVGEVCLPAAGWEGAYTTYVLEVVSPPLPVQLVWKNSPRGLSIRS